MWGHQAGNGMRPEEEVALGSTKGEHSGSPWVWGESQVCGGIISGVLHGGLNVPRGFGEVCSLSDNTICVPAAPAFASAVGMPRPLVRLFRSGRVLPAGSEIGK